MPLYLFESNETLQLFRKAYVALPSLCQSVDELLFELSPQRKDASPKERRFLLCSLLPPELQSEIHEEALLKTIELLRESLIFTSEHVEHCFSVLPQTPKNSFLKKLMNDYLSSDLAHDRTEQLWKLVGELKAKQRVLREKNIVCIRGGNRSTLFLELVQALRYSHDVEMKEAHEVFPAKATPPTAFQGNPDRLLKALAEKCLTLPRAIIAWGGTPGQRLFLESYLHHLKLSLPSEPLHPLTLWEKIRQCQALPLLRRLELSNQFLDLNETDEERLRHRLLPEEQSALEQPEKAPEKAEESKFPPQIYLVPFQSLLSLPETPLLTFVDESELRWNEEDFFLTAEERETLFRQGFSVPRPSEQRSHRISVAQALTHQGPLFTPEPEVFKLTATDLPDSNVAFSAEKSYHVPLTVKAFSATQLETYAQCPSRYFLTNRLRLRVAQPTEERSALFFGQAVHLALENILKEKLPLSPDTLRELFKKAMTAVAPTLEPHATVMRLLLYQFEKIIPRFISLEATIASLFPESRPTQFESAFTRTINGVALTGKIDRIDTLKDGSLLILDYKTGKIDFTPDHIAKGYHFQALLYLLGVRGEVAGMLFYDLKEGELRRGILREEYVSIEAKKAVTRGHCLNPEKWTTVIEAGIEHIERLTAQIAKGDFSPTPDTETCHYCEVSTLCRKGLGYV